MTDINDDSNIPNGFQKIDRAIDDLLEGKLPSEDDLLSSNSLGELLPAMQMLIESGKKEQQGSTPAEPERKYSQLGGYKILREIGRGGMGLVFEAIEISLGRRVAVKVLTLTAMQNKEKVARFEREAQAAASLEHPRIVRAYARGEDRGIYYLAMQFIDGQDLATYIRKRRIMNISDSNAQAPLSSSLGVSYFQEIARIGQQVAEGLHYAHENHVIHRDIKPSNLILDKEGDVHIADFGLATLENSTSLTTTGSTLGTLRYSSPEQARGSREFDVHTDIYSLGVTLYELITLTPAFPGDEPIGLLHDIQDREPIRPCKIVPKLSGDLESVILKAMSKEPRHRYQTALELAEDLQRFLRKQPVHAKRPTLMRRCTRWVQRNQMASILFSMTMLLVLAASFIVTNVWPYNEDLQHALDATNELEAKQELRIKEQKNAERQLREVQYVADLRDSHQAWRERNPAQAKRLLRKHIPIGDEEDIRGFVWRRLWKQYHQSCLTELKGHQGAVYHLAFSPDERILASSSSDGTVNLWDIKAKSLAGTLRGHSDEVNHICFSKDGKTLASASDDRTVRIWDVASRKTIKILTGNEDRVFAVAISPDGKTVVSGGCDHTIRVFDIQTGAIRKIIREHTDMIQDIAFSPDGKLLASVGDDFRLILWDTDSYSMRISQVDNNSRLFCTSFSHTGDILITAGDKTPVRIWNSNNGNQRSELLGGTVGNSVAFSPDDSLLAIANAGGAVQVLNLTTREQISLFNHNQEANDVAFSHNGMTVATACADGIVRLWSLPQIKMDVHSLAFDQKSETFVTSGADSEITIRDWPTARVLKKIHTGWNRQFPIYAMRLSPGGRYLAATNFAKFEFLDLSSGKLTTHGDFTQGPNCIAFSLDGRYLVEGGTGNIRFLDPVSAQAKEILLHKSRINSLVFSSDGETLFSGYSNGTLVIWDVASRSRIDSIKSHSVQVDFIVLLPNESAFISGCRSSGIIELWDASTHKLIGEIETNSSGIRTLAVSPDGRTMAIGTRDGTLKLWSLVSKKQIFRYQTGALEIRDITFSRNGAILAFILFNSAEDGKLHLWHAATDLEVAHDLGQPQVAK